MLNPDIIRQQIANIRLQFPELAEDEEAWALTIESETDAVDLLRQVERRRQEAEAFAGGIASNIAELELRQKRFERREQAMRAIAFKIMEAADLRKLEMPEATYSIRNGQPKLLGEADPESLPVYVRRVKIEPDRTAIKEALQRGDLIPGFTLSNAEPSLAIRTR